jgi:hypothetical protein
MSPREIEMFNFLRLTTWHSGARHVSHTDVKAVPPNRHLAWALRC